MNQDTDLIINGGGFAGLALGLACAGSGLRVAIIEPLEPALQREDRFDGRTTALAYTSKLMFERLGLWEHLADRAGAIRDIRIVDGQNNGKDSPLWLHYDHKDVGDRPMGYIVENRYLKRALLDAVAENRQIALRTGAAFVSYVAEDGSVTVTLSDGNTLRAKLLVGADGKHSPTRLAAGITARQVDYGQTAIVCTVRHEKHHQGVAVERFLPDGPFAILPMGRIADEPAGHHSSLVWTENSKLVPHYLQMNERDFGAAVRSRFGDYLGKLEVVGGRWSYALKLTMASEYTAHRVALVGDAAHAIHPIAGQGYNLGMRDVAALADCILEAHRGGEDIGESTILENYARARRADSAMMIAATDGLNRLFSNDLAPVRLARRLGLAAVEQLPPLKKQFMRHAMGIRRNAAALMHEEQ